MTPVARVRAGAAAVACALVAVGLPLILLLSPPYTHALVVRVDAPALAGLDVDETVAYAEQVRAFVAGAEGVTLPASLPDGRPAFDAKAASHLEDVRDALHGARLATLLAAMAAGAWALWAIGAGRRRELAVSLRGAAWAVAAVVGLAALAAVVDFEGFFAAFHGVFFEEGTWRFASDALIIALFPERFWMISGAAWGALAFAGALAFWLLGRRLGAQP